MLNSLIGFLSGVGISLIGIVATSIWEKQNTKKDKIASVEFEIYMRMLNLYNLYFWVTCEEIKGKQVNIETKDMIRNEAWKIADLLRTEDNVKSLNDILKVLMSNEYASATERHNDMSKILDDLGSNVNKRYQGAVHIISQNNIQKIPSIKESVFNTTVPVSIGQLGQISDDQ